MGASLSNGAPRARAKRKERAAEMMDDFSCRRLTSNPGLLKPTFSLPSEQLLLLPSPTLHRAASTTRHSFDLCAFRHDVSRFDDRG